MRSNYSLLRRFGCQLVVAVSLSFGFFGLALSADGVTGDRVALVIGNAAYKLAPLSNPRNDAQAMATLLRQAGFSVDNQLDATREQLTEAVERFGKTIKDPKVKFGLFYYAGHGLQLDWRNYLVPVNANIRSVADVRQQTVDVSEMLKYMEEGKGRSFLVILDACRDDPFAGAFRPPVKGLSQFDAPVGSLLAYATAPGGVAMDGTGENGLYTSNLLREFAVRGAKIEDAFKRVRLNVRLASQGRQVPWESTSLEEDVYLFPDERKKYTEAEQEQQFDQEIKSWLRVKSTTDQTALANFIREFPSGSASELAMARMNRLLAMQSVNERKRMEESRIQLAQAESIRIAAEREESERQAAALRAEQALATARAEALRTEAARVQALAEAAALRAQELAAQKAATALAEQKAVEAAQRLAELDRAKQAAIDSIRQAEAARVAEKEKSQIATQIERAAAEREESARQAAALRAEQALETARADAQRVEAARVLALAQAAALQAQEVAAQNVAAAMAAQKAVETAQRQAELDRAKQAAIDSVRLADAARVAEKEKAQVVAQLERVAPQPEPVAVVGPTPYSKGFSEHQRSYAVGDEYVYRVIDSLTKISQPLTMKVSAVNATEDRVEYNGGQYSSDLMGNIVSNLRGGFNTPRQFYPAELFVGKKWRSEFKQTRANGVTFTFRYDLRVVAREEITVPAGTFNAFKIEARGFNMQLGAALSRNIWVVPGIAADIAHETLVRLRSGSIDQYDRQELVSMVVPR